MLKPIQNELQVIKKPATFSILSYIADLNGCGYIRILIPTLILNQAKLDGYKIISVYSRHIINEIGIIRHLSFIQFQRATTLNHLREIVNFKNNIKKITKTPIVYEIDDLLFNIPKWNYASDYYSKNKKYIEEILKIVDGITCSTEKLKEFYTPYNNNISVIPNHLTKMCWGWDDIKKKHDNNPNTKKPRILYAGSSNHFGSGKIKDSNKTGGDFDLKLLDFISKTTDKYQWVFVGGLPYELEHLKNTNKIEYHNWISEILQYPNYLKKLNIDFGIAPLEINDFNSCKSNIKALEYTALGVPGVYTKISPYENFKCTSVETDGIISYIEKIATDLDFRKKVYEHDYNIVKDDLFWEENDNVKKYINSYLSLFGKRIED